MSSKTVAALKEHQASFTISKSAKENALDVWKIPVNRILQKVEEEDSRFEVQVIYCGSFYENTKVKEPNEFDLMLEIKDLTLGSWDPYDSDDEDNLSRDPPLGYTTVMIDQGEELKWRHKGCIPRNKYLLSGAKAKALFADYVRKAIVKLGKSKIEVMKARSSGPAVKLKIITVLDTTYSIDLTLAIKDKSWPEDAEEWITRPRRGWPLKKLIDEIVQEGCHLVAKKPKEASADESEFYWRYSFSAAEKKLALQGHGEPGTCSRNVLRHLKSLREKHHIELSPLSSYHLKTIMFYEQEEFPEPGQWTEDNMSIRIKSALARLSCCLRNRMCPHYFIKDFNLFDTRFDKRYEKLIRLIDDIKEDPKKYLRQSKTQN